MHRTSLLLLLAVLPLAGCAEWSSKTKHTLMPWTVDDDPQMPTKVVAMWSDSVAYPAGRPPLRGFGARLTFYAKDPNKPIKVDGSLDVYGFDETGRRADNTKPDRKFVFTAEELAKHYSKSEGGHSYSIWVPWDGVDNPQTTVSLIVRFTPKIGGGNVVISEQAMQFLPGTKPGSDLAKTNPAADRGVQQVSHTEISQPQVANGVDAASRLKTTTINVPIRSGLRNASMPYTNTPAVQPVQQPISPASGFVAPASSSAGGVSAGSPSQAQALQTQMAQQWSARYVPPRSQALGGPIAQPRVDYVPTQPLPGAQPSYPGSSPLPTAP